MTATLTTDKWLEISQIPLEKIKRSPTNPRKKFDKKAQDELEGSMLAHGFTMSTLLVRPLADTHYLVPVDDTGITQLCRKTQAGVETVETFPHEKQAAAALAAVDGCFELVAGERRWRAAQAVGVKTAPCIIHQLSDNEVMVLQLIENLQREDLTPMEEAEGYRNILGLKDEAGARLYTVQTLAGQVGKSADVIQQRLRLCRLEGEAREAVEAGLLPPRTAILIARIPDEKLRKKATKAILHPQYEEAPLSLRKAEELVRREFMRDLGSAPFDQADEELVPVETDLDWERIGGGSCKDCPMKSGNMGGEELATNAKNLCLNPVCYGQKCEAGWRVWQAANTDPAKNRRALGREESAQIYTYGDQRAWNSGLVDLDEHPDSNDLRPGAYAAGKWRKLVKGSEIEVIVAKDKNGAAHELVNRALAIQAAINKGHTQLFKETVATTSAENGGEEGGYTETSEKWEAEREARRRENALCDAKEKALLLALGKSAVEHALPDYFWRKFVQREIDYGDDDEVLRLHDLDNEVDVGSLAPADLMKLAVAFVANEFVNYHVDDDTDKKAWAAAFKLDLKAIEKEALRAFDAAEKAEREVSPGVAWMDNIGPRAMLAGDPDAGAEVVFGWSKDDICEKPARAMLELPKALKIEARIFAASDENGWYSGYQVDINDEDETKRKDTWVQVTRKEVAPVPTLLRALIDAGYAARKWLTEQTDAPQKAIKSVSNIIAAMVEKEGLDSIPKSGVRDKVVEVLTAAGAEGLTVAEVAEKIGEKKNNMNVWFYTSGRSVPGLKKVGPGRFALIDSPAAPPAAEERIDHDALGWLTNCPSGDVNFKGAIKKANLATLDKALENQEITKTARKALASSAAKLRKAAK